MMVKTMDVVILCGGLGSRLQSVLEGRQKVMARVHERPFLDVLLGYVQDQGGCRVVLCTGYKAQAVEEYYQKHNFKLNISFSQEDSPRGTGGAIFNAQAHIQSKNFIVLNGDSYCAVDFNQLRHFHEQAKAKVTMVVTTVTKANDYGRIVFDDQGVVTSFQEKQALTQEHLTYVNAGVYCLAQEIFLMMPKKQKFSLEHECFPRWVGQGFYAMSTKKKFLDIGTPQRYARAEQDIERKSLRDD